MRVAGRAFEVAFYVAVAAGLLWIAAHFTVTRSGWVRQTVQKLVAQEVANYLGQEISIGRIGGDIWRTVRIEGFSVSGPDGRPDIAVERIELKWDLAAALRKKAPLPATVRRVRLVRPYIRLARDAKGRWNLERLPAAERIEPKKLRPLPITLEIVDGAVDYDIVVREFRGRREVGRLQHISATFVLTHDGVAFLNAKLEADCPYLRSAKVKAAYQLKGKSGAVEVAAEGLVLRAAGALVKRKMPAQLLSGTADAQLSAWIAGPKQQPHWTVRARVSNLAVRPRSVKTTIYAPQLSLAASDNGATISAQRVNWDGGQCNLQASVWDYKKPMISASLTGLTVDPQAAVDAAPPEVEQKLLETFGKHVQCGRVTGQLSLIGPLQHLNLTADL
ncbi:MAG: hypothetical protein H5T86_16050, partial [Armatimonadetes bacterium]|nr:hypothetical protein [Armatimonadota bacterium]